jgi:uncharacterized RDD family membrane protein YckC
MVKLDLPGNTYFYGPASFWKRVIAFLIDLFIIDLFVVGFFREALMRIISAETGMMATYRMLESGGAQAEALYLIFTIMVLLTLAYFVLLQYTTGQTVGGILANMHVVSQKEGEDAGLQKISFWQCIVRNLFIIPAIPFILLWVADPVFMLFAKKGQRMTEWLSGTKVVEKYRL